MCIAVPAEILEILGREGKVEMIGVITTVNLQLIENPQLGEFVLVHAGCAIEKINKDHFDDLSNIFKKIMDGDEERDG